VRKLALTIGPGDLEEVLDRLLPLLPQGVHELPVGDRLELAVYGDAPPREQLEAAVGPALLAAAEGEADEDPVRRRLAESARPPVGGRVVIRAEEAPPAPADALDIVIDGLGGVFGAGTHPTTEMCLELLLALEPAGAFADLGCGTGVLAITAAKLGFDPVLALDHEELAVAAARANARRNAVDVEARQADLLEAALPHAATLAANVPPKVHARLALELPEEVRAVIASGLDEERLKPALVAYARAGLVLAERLERGNWIAALLVRDA
jgi:ribosomal protein L11 methyltransferase